MNSKIIRLDPKPYGQAADENSDPVRIYLKANGHEHAESPCSIMLMTFEPYMEVVHAFFWDLEAIFEWVERNCENPVLIQENGSETRWLTMVFLDGQARRESFANFFNNSKRETQFRLRDKFMPLITGAIASRNHPELYLVKAWMNDNLLGEHALDRFSQRFAYPITAYIRDRMDAGHFRLRWSDFYEIV